MWTVGWRVWLCSVVEICALALGLRSDLTPLFVKVTSENSSRLVRTYTKREEA